MERLKQLRQAKNMNQRRLAMELNISQAMISKYERGESDPNNDTIRIIAKYFDVSTDYLLEMSDDKHAIAPGLSQDEKEVLFGFKKLDSVQKEKLKAYLKGLLQE